MLAHLVPPQVAPWSSRRPWPTTPSQCPARHRMPPDPASTTPGIHQRPPTLRNGDAPSYGNRCWWPSGPSTGNRCGGRRSWHPWPGGRRRGADGTRAGVAAAAGVGAGCTPITRQVYANCDERSFDRYSCRSLLEQRKSAHRISSGSPIGIVSKLDRTQDVLPGISRILGTSQHLLHVWVSTPPS
jgi:hypothetical protein